ncbi:unnamed protein product [Phaedon cochleariae]|uniref:Suppressor of cytokine signaling 6 n=1 Tax=Phaedon cochleariae TaxID=80249 RepID=A0A9N9X1G9_PHACE|nr:unnamed protein product [Phaedon cochleariae]
MANPNNKSKNWLSRLRDLRIRRRSLDSSEQRSEDNILYRRGIYVHNNISSNNDPQTQSSWTRNGFRRSILKMHNRVKDVFKQKNTNSNTSTTRHTIAVVSNGTSSSHISQRVTLSSPARHVENIYSFGPVKKPAGSPNSERPSPRVSPCPARITLASPVPSNSSVSISAPAPVVPPRRRNFAQLSPEAPNGSVPKNEIANLTNYYWYWGPISRSQAEDRLKDSPDGAFLVRDSTADRYIFTMSFRSIGKILHTRIEYTKSGYSLFDQVGYKSIAELVEDAIMKSKNSVYCYTKTRDFVQPNFPVRLTLPVSRYDKVPTLKYLSRFVIRQFVIINDMDKLPLPDALISYLQEQGPYF